MDGLEQWWAQAAAALGVDPRLETQALLDLAREVAHGVMRPAAPLSTYLLGLAVGSGADPEQAAARLLELADGWQPG